MWNTSRWSRALAFLVGALAASVFVVPAQAQSAVQLMARLIGSASTLVPIAANAEGGLATTLYNSAGVEVSVASPSVAENTPAANSDLVQPVGFVRTNTTPGSLGSVALGANGDRTFGYVDGNGRIYTQAVFYTAAGAEMTFATDPTHDGAKGTSGPQSMLAAVAHSATPTEVTAADAVNWIASRAGLPFVIGGHPNVISAESQVQDADGAQTDLALVTCGAGCKVVVTFVSVTCDPDTTDDTAVRIGFGAASVPGGVHTGVAGVLIANDGVVPGGGAVNGNGGGILGIGADGEDLRLTIGDPVGGSCNVKYTYYTSAS